MKFYICELQIETLVSLPEGSLMPLPGCTPQSNCYSDLYQHSSSTYFWTWSKWNLTICIIFATDFFVVVPESQRKYRALLVVVIDPSHCQIPLSGWALILPAPKSIADCGLTAVSLWGCPCLSWREVPKPCRAPASVIGWQGVVKALFQLTAPPAMLPAPEWPAGPQGLWRAQPTSLSALPPQKVFLGARLISVLLTSLRLRLLPVSATPRWGFMAPSHNTDKETGLVKTKCQFSPQLQNTV